MNQKTIVLIEDNPDDEALTVRALKKNNILNPVTVLRDGAEASEFLFNGDDKSHQNIAVVLLDLKLPKVDGRTILKRIRETESTQFIPVVVLTSSKEEQDIFQSYRLHANSYIRKPVDFNQFVEAVKNLGLYWLVLNEVPSSSHAA